jgi:hypothetical protein
MCHGAPPSDSGRLSFNAWPGASHASFAWGFLGFLLHRSRAFDRSNRNRHSEGSPRSEEALFDPCVLTLWRVSHTLALSGEGPQLRVGSCGFFWLVF